MKPGTLVDALLMLVAGLTASLVLGALCAFAQGLVDLIFEWYGD